MTGVVEFDCVCLDAKASDSVNSTDLCRFAHGHQLFVEMEYTLIKTHLYLH